MKGKKRIKQFLLMVIVIFAMVVYHEPIYRFIITNYIYHNYATPSLQKNEYAQERDFEFVQITDNFVATDKQHLLNIFYTILDSGVNSFYFYCDELYTDCKKDVDNLIPDEESDSILADLNNFVHPYNSYKTITISYNDFGKVSVIIEKQYSSDKITEINNEIENIKSQIIEDNMSDREIIKAFHDYIINYTSYDVERAEEMDSVAFSNSTTHTAYGLLETQKALCGGYSDITSIFLTQYHFPNIRISADNHVWNLVYLDDTWYHLDVTWDDPVTTTGAQILIYDYFLISYDTLLETDSVEHQFNQDVYLEAK